MRDLTPSTLRKKLSGLTRAELVELVELTESAAQEDESKLGIYSPTSDVMKAFHESDAKLRSLMSGNRGGKTGALCIETIARTTGILPKELDATYPKHKIRLPCYARLVGVNYREGIEKILKPELLKWLPPEMIEGYSAELMMLSLTNGSKIEFMSYDQERAKFGGVSRGFVGLDEICPPDVLKENIMRVADVGGDLVIAFTAVMEEKDDKGRVTSNAESIAYFYDQIYLKARRVVDDNSDVVNPDGFPGYECFHHNSLSNIHINLEALKEWAKTLSPKDRAARIEGKFTHLMGLIYGEVYNENTRVIKPFEVDKDWPVFVAIDSHLKKPHCVTYMTIDPHGRKFVIDELKIPGLVDDIANDMKALEKLRDYWIMWRIIDPIANTRDPITGTCVADELRSKGITPLESGSKDKVTGIHNTREAFRADELYIFDRCTWLRWELAHYIYSGEKPLDKDDDFCENLRRLIMKKPFFMDRQTYLFEVTRQPNWRRY